MPGSSLRNPLSIRPPIRTDVFDCSPALRSMVGCRRQLALEAVEQCRPPKDQARDFALTGAIIRADPGEHPADEPIVGEGIDQNAARGGVLHLSQYCRRRGLCIPQDADRQQIFSRRLALRRDVQDQDDSVIVGQPTRWNSRSRHAEHLNLWQRTSAALSGSRAERRPRAFGRFDHAGDRVWPGLAPRIRSEDAIFEHRPSVRRA